MHFANLLKLSPDYLNFGLIETNGTLFCSGLSTNANVDLGDRPYFQRVMRRKEFCIGDFQVGRLSDQPALNFGYPVFDEKQELKRVLYASLKLSLLSESARQIHLPAGGSIVIMDRDGNVLARHPNSESWIGRCVSQTPFFKQISMQGTGVYEMAAEDDTFRLNAVTVIKNGASPGMFVSVGVPLESSFAHANRVLLRNCIVLAAVALLVFFCGQLYSQYFFVRPINTLAAAAQRLAEGGLGSRVGSINGPEELVQLGKTFDEMAERLQKRHEEILHAQQHIAQLNESLERRVEERTAQLEAVNKELEAFSYSVSHDLRSPLRHIDGFVDMLRGASAGKLDAKGTRYLDVISDSAKQMGRLIDDLLAFSRMGRAEISQSKVDLNQMVAEVLTDLKPDVQDRNISWKITPLPEVCGDEAMLRQVFANLIGNAIKYTRPRNPAEVQIGLQDHPNEIVILFTTMELGSTSNMPENFSAYSSDCTAQMNSKEPALGWRMFVE